MNDTEFAYSEDDLWDPGVSMSPMDLLMNLPAVEEMAIRLLPCEEPCEHLSCEIDRIGIK